MKLEQPTDVLTAARERLRIVFRDFDNVYVSLSGGKDSGVLLFLALEAARAANKLPLHVMTIDLEGQYAHTIDFVRRCFNREDVTGHWICLPIHLRNAVSQFQPFWCCWDPDLKDQWIRSMPEHPRVVSDPTAFPFFRRGMEFEEFVPLYGEWIARGMRVVDRGVPPGAVAGRTCCLVGIRSDESLNRFRTIASQSKRTWQGHQWTTKLSADALGSNAAELYNAYPIYDWRTEDIWIANGKLGFDYNKVYDLMQLAGLSVHEMRLCQPYGDDQRKGLWLFKILEPDTWAKVVARVEGANFGSQHASDMSMGHLKVVLPEGRTWQGFAGLLLDTMPPHLSTHYGVKIKKFIAWWAKRGFPDGIPDAADPKLEAQRKAPSWRRVVKALVKNDYWVKGLGFSQTQGEFDKRLLLVMRFLENR